MGLLSDQMTGLHRSVFAGIAELVGIIGLFLSSCWVGAAITFGSFIPPPSPKEVGSGNKTPSSDEGPVR